MSRRKNTIEPTTPVAQRVDNGVAALDAKAPGWRSKIDGERLRLSSHVQCVLGQVFGDYEAGLAVLGLTELEAFDFGFNSLYVNVEYELITEWLIRL